MKTDQLPLPVRLLQVSCMAVFLGRAWQHLLWDAPFRTLLWDEGLLKGFVESTFDVTWFEYVTSPTTDLVIQILIRSTGIIYLLGIFATWLVFSKKWEKFSRFLLLLGSVGLFMLAVLYCKEKYYQLGQLIEYSSQFGAPLLLWWVSKSETKRVPVTAIKVAIALTFIGHGLYALGYYPLPGHFVDMTINTLGVSEEFAKSMLFAAGVIDMIVAIGIFIPAIQQPMLLYMVAWGVLTSLARITAHIDAQLFTATLGQWLHETIYRVPHAVFPMIAFIIIRSIKPKEEVILENA
ncbi:hypothetical protein V6R21_08645 [Limibacter armeniacum]|uniref:hypothetical protein n=1 Tax=Limibacter armeniacum TaxID=466084 RepID=UPI002FE58619